MSRSPSQGRRVLRSITAELKLTPEGGVALALALVLSVLGAILRRYEFYTLGVFLSASVFIDTVIAVYAGKGTVAEVERVKTPGKVVLGSEAPVKCRGRVVGLKALPALLRDRLPAEVSSDKEPESEGSGIVELIYYVRPKLRGRFKIGPLTLRIPSPLRFSFVDYRFPGTTEVEIDAVPTFYAESPRVAPPKPSRLVPGRHAVRASGGFGDFIKLREYVPGDDVRLIHWGASARNTRMVPYVRELLVEAQFQVFVVVDASPETSLRYEEGRRVIDDMVDAAGSVLLTAVSKGDPAGVYLMGSPTVALPPTRRKERLYLALKWLETLEPQEAGRLKALPEVAGRFLERGTTVIVLSPLTSVNLEGISTIVQGLKALSLKPFFIVPDIPRYVGRVLSSNALEVISAEVSEEIDRIRKVREVIISSGGYFILAGPNELKDCALRVYLGEVVTS
ncbi:MAG: DUF58 domain-containing protein [Desulfurococcales archaeon]|nr:DUF58 domain-containing protein [Desulfurococcales archaeon]